MSVKLYLRDNMTGTIHEYGTDQHDSLILQEDGSLHYENLQNGCGTMFPEEGYSFCRSDGGDPREDEVVKCGDDDPILDVGGDSWSPEPIIGGVQLDRMAAMLGIHRAVGETDRILARRCIEFMERTPPGHCVPARRDGE